MCDYSLHFVASRPAKVGDELVVSNFPNSITRGLTAAEAPRCAVCLLPGTEVAFENYVRYDRVLRLFGRGCVPHKVARFLQVNMHDPHVHHDALEFPNGQILMVTRLVPGQRLTVLQLPAQQSRAKHGNPQRKETVTEIPSY